MDDWDDDDSIYIECEHGCGNKNHPDETECGYCGEPVVGTGLQVYVPKKFTEDHMTIIQQAAVFMAEFKRDGYKMSLRQLYYQFVANVHDFPNTEASYKRLGKIITDARLAGHLDFETIEDRGRVCSEVWTQIDPMAVLEDLEYSYAEDYWADQDNYVEVWVEKDALSSIIERPCRRLKVPFLACKGYMSASAAWEAGNRFKAAQAEGKNTVLIHLGDHDPSGIDMTRDNGARLEMFTGKKVEVRRIGLNMDQIIQYDPPPNPTKVTDSRAKEYLRRFGETCWELDALKPGVIAKLITDEVEKFVDPAQWNAVIDREKSNRRFIRKIEENRAAVFDFVRGIEE